MNHHDVPDEALAAVAFPVDLSLTSYRFFWKRRFRLDPEFVYWWREFARTSFDRWMLFETEDYCNAFKKVCAEHDIDPDFCIVVPKRLYPIWGKNNLAVIVTDFEADEHRLLHLSAHYSQPESH